MDMQILAAIGALTLVYWFCRALLWFSRVRDRMKDDSRQ